MMSIGITSKTLLENTFSKITNTVKNSFAVAAYFWK